MSALTRMSANEHRNVTITPMDFIIISANPIPGNEKYVTKVVNDLMRLGAEVIYESMYEVHVSDTLVRKSRNCCFLSQSQNSLSLYMVSINIL